MPKVIQVIESTEQRGNGREDPFRSVTQYHNFDGDLLAEVDPCDHAGQVLVPQEALDWLNGEHADGFSKPEGARGEFWWRSEFRRIAGL